MATINKEELMSEVELKYSTHSYDQQSYELADEVADLAEEWIQENEGRIPDMPRRRIRLEMRKYVRSKIDMTDETKGYFVPAFIWAWAAQQIITWAIKLIVEKYFTPADETPPE